MEKVDMNKYSIEQIDTDKLPEAYGPAPAKELVDSVSVYGILQPLIIQRGTEGEPEELTIVDGNRRLMAARRAKLDTVPAIILKQTETTTEDTSRLTLQMNNLRSTNDYAEQVAYENIAFADTERAEAVAKESGLSRASIGKRARWNVAHNGIMEAFFEHRIAATVVDAVSKLPANLQVDAYSRFENEGKLTAADVKEIEAKAKEPVQPKTPGETYAEAKAQAETAMNTMMNAAADLHGADMIAWISGWKMKAIQKLEIERAQAERVAIDEVPF